MTSPGPAALTRLADELSAVSHRLGELGAEVRSLQAAPLPPEPQYAPPPLPPVWTPLPPAPLPPAPRPSAPLPSRPSTPLPPAPPAVPPWGPQWGPQAPPREPRPTLWDRLGREGAGSRLLAWIGGGVTLAGVVLLLVLAVQRGYIGPVPRVLAGAALSAALVTIGLTLYRRPTGRVGALALAATGFAGLYLDVVAATVGYHFLPAAGGLGAGLVVAAAGVLVAHRWHSETVALFVVLGCAVSAPVITGGIDAMLVGFLLVLQVATSPVSLTHRWTGLGIAGMAPPVVAVLALTGSEAVVHHTPVVVLALAFAAGAVQLAYALVASARGQQLAVVFAAVAPVPTLLAALLVARPTGAAVVAAFGAICAATWILRMLRAIPVGDAVTLVSGIAALVAGFEALSLALDGQARTDAVLGSAVLLAVLALRMRYPGAVIAGGVFAAIGTLDGLGSVVRPALLARAPYDTVPASVIAALATTGLLVAVAALATAVAADRVIERSDPAAARTRWIIAALVALYGASAALLAAGLAVSPDVDGFRGGHVLVTVSWTLAAIVLLLRKIDSTPCRVAGLALVGAAVAKLVLFDLASLDGIPRVIAFLGAGLALLAAGAKYAALVARRA